MTADNSLNDNRSRQGRRLLFRAWIRKKDGTKVWARQYGKRAFPIWIDDNDHSISPE